MIVDSATATLAFSKGNQQVSWQGYSFTDCAQFGGFLTELVASRLRDAEGVEEFDAHLRGLATTEFQRESLAAILGASSPDECSWAVGEALAEAWLSEMNGIVWPWNMARDKRNPNASLAGADLIGFCQDGERIQLVLGEVKTSGERKYPPQVMYGRSGMTHQIDRLSTDLSLLGTLLRWLLPRCKGTQFEHHFDMSVKALLSTGNRAITLFGVLVRDTPANEEDLRSRGESLKNSIVPPTSCSLIALYIPFSIADLLDRVKGAGPHGALAAGCNP